MSADRPADPTGHPDERAGVELPARRRRRRPFWIDIAAVGGLVAAIVFLYARVVRVAYIPTGSMMPTINPGDRVLISLGAYGEGSPQPGDIIAFWAEDMGDYEVKRVIGVGGDKMVVGLGLVFRNGKRLDEPYVAEPMLPEQVVARDVPEGELFLMGDNRNGSEDSRDYGTVREDQVLGKVFFRILPFMRAGPVA